MAIFEEKQSDANARQRNYSGENGSESKREGGREKKIPRMTTTTNVTEKKMQVEQKITFPIFSIIFQKALFSIYRKSEQEQESRERAYIRILSPASLIGIETVRGALVHPLYTVIREYLVRRNGWRCEGREQFVHSMNYD